MRHHAQPSPQPHLTSSNTTIPPSPPPLTAPTKDYNYETSTTKSSRRRTEEAMRTYTPTTSTVEPSPRRKRMVEEMLDDFDTGDRRSLKTQRYHDERDWERDWGRYGDRSRDRSYYDQCRSRSRSRSRSPDARYRHHDGSRTTGRPRTRSITSEWDADERKRSLGSRITLRPDETSLGQRIDGRGLGERIETRAMSLMERIGEGGNGRGLMERISTGFAAGAGGIEAREPGDNGAIQRLIVDHIYEKFGVVVEPIRAGKRGIDTRFSYEFWGRAVVLEQLKMHEWRYDEVDSLLRSGEFLVVRQGRDNSSGQSHHGMEYDYEYSGHHTREPNEGLAKLISRHVWKQYNVDVSTELIDEHGVGNLFRYVFHSPAYKILYKPRLPIEKWKYKGIRSWLQRGIIEIVPIQPDDFSSGPSSSSPGPPSSSVPPPTSSTRQSTPRLTEEQEEDSEDMARLVAVQTLIATHISEKFGVLPAFKTVGIYNIGSEFEAVYSGQARALVLRRMAKWGKEEVQRALRTGEMRIVRRGQGGKRPERGERGEENGVKQRLPMLGVEGSRERNETQQVEKRGSNPATPRREWDVINLLDDGNDTRRIGHTARTTSTRITTTDTVATTISTGIKHTHTNTENPSISTNDNTEEDEGSPMSLSGATPDPVPVPQLQKNPSARGTLIPPPLSSRSHINMDTEMERQRGEEMDMQVPKQLSSEIRDATKKQSPRNGELRSQSMGDITALNASGQQRAELFPSTPAHHHSPPQPPAIHSNHSTATHPPPVGPTLTDIAMHHTHPRRRPTVASKDNHEALSSNTDSDSDATETDEELLFLSSVENLGDLPAGGGRGVIPVTPWVEEEAVGSVHPVGVGNEERTRKGVMQDGDGDNNGGEEGGAVRKKSRSDEPTRPVPSAPGTAASTATATWRLHKPTATPSSSSSSSSSSPSASSSTLPHRPETETKSCPPPPQVLGQHPFPLHPRPTVDQNPHQLWGRETNPRAAPTTTRDVKQELQQSHKSQESERKEGEVREEAEAEEDEGELPTDPWKRHLEMLRRRKKKVLRELAMAGVQ